MTKLLTIDNTEQGIILSVFRKDDRGIKVLFEERQGIIKASELAIKIKSVLAARHLVVNGFIWRSANVSEEKVKLKTGPADKKKLKRLLKIELAKHRQSKKSFIASAFVEKISEGELAGEMVVDLSLITVSQADYSLTKILVQKLKVPCQGFASASSLAL